MEITKKQIIALDKGETTARELFPDVFQTKLEVGKWYVANHFGSLYLAFINSQDKDYFLGYGFNKNKNYRNDFSFLKNFDYKWTLATEEEVTEALKNEAVKRGFINGALIKKTGINKDFIFNFNPINENDFKYFSKLNILDSKEGHIFDNGIWAEVIQTITKEEAENILGKTIV
jgi:hypothetical protein